MMIYAAFFCLLNLTLGVALNCDKVIYRNNSATSPGLQNKLSLKKNELQLFEKVYVNRCFIQNKKCSIKIKLKNDNDSMMVMTKVVKLTKTYTTKRLSMEANTINNISKNNKSGPAPQIYDCGKVILSKSLPPVGVIFLESMKEDLKAKLKNGDTVDLLQRLNLFKKASEALHALHRLDIIYCGVDPQSIMCNDDQCSLMTFKDFDYARKTGICGKNNVHTLAPEFSKYQNKKPLLKYRKKPDIYALGMSLISLQAAASCNVFSENAKMFGNKSVKFTQVLKELKKCEDMTVDKLVDDILRNKNNISDNKRVLAEKIARSLFKIFRQMISEDQAVRPTAVEVSELFSTIYGAARFLNAANANSKNIDGILRKDFKALDTYLYQGPLKNAKKW